MRNERWSDRQIIRSAGSEIPCTNEFYAETDHGARISRLPWVREYLWYFQWVWEIKSPRQQWSFRKTGTTATLASQAEIGVWCKFGPTFVWLSGMFPAFRCNYSWFTPASPLSRVCPRRRGGSPSGDLSAPPALSLRGCGPKALDRPPTVGRMREGDFPPLAIPVGNEGEFTHVILLTLSAWSMRFVPTAFRPSDVARGFVWVPLIPGRDLNSMFPADT